MILSNITKIYSNKDGSRKKVLDNIDLVLNDVGMVIINGPSGSGKTTLLNIISGIDKKYNGVVKNHLNFEYTGQEVCLFESLNVYQNLLLVSDDQNEINRYIDDFKLTDCKHKKVKKLSNGQKRRVQIVRSLLAGKDGLLCDEPTAALDIDNAEIIMNHLKLYSKDHLVVLVTHDVFLSEKYADRLIKIENGKIVADVVVNTTRLLDNQPNEATKHRAKDSFAFAFKYFLSRINEYLFYIFLSVIVLLISYTTFQLFINANFQSDSKETFRKNTNLIISHPISDTIFKNGRNVYANYDRYSKRQIEMLVDNIEDIIAVQMYVSCDDSLLDRNSGTAKDRNITEQEFIEMLNYEFAYRDDVFFTTNTYPVIIDGEITYITSSDPINSLPFFYGEDYVRYDGGYVKDNSVQFYDLVNGYEPELLYGEMPTGNDEVIVAVDFADYLVNHYNLNDVDELVGKDIRVGVYTDSQVNYNDIDLKPHEFNLTISGITSIENDDWLIFFNNGLMGDIFMQKLLKDPARFEAETVRIYIDPSSDANKIVNRLNEIIDSHYSSFMEYKKAEENGVGYRSFTNLLLYLILLDTIFAIIYLIYKLSKYKRNIKEKYLLDHYGYNSLQINLMKTFLYTSISILIFIFAINIICPYINLLAANYNYSYFIQLDVTSVTVEILIFILIMLFIDQLVKG